MSYTAHGWHIEGTERDTRREIGPGPSCTGPTFCLPCRKEIQMYGMLIGTDDDHQIKAREIVTEYVKKKYGGEKVFAVYVVMFSYVLGNWKALVSTTIPDKMYYEVTYDKQNKAAYLDAYAKQENITIPDNSPFWMKGCGENSCNYPPTHGHGPMCDKTCDVCRGLPYFGREPG